jgi:sigma-54 dependent transcriptional regulator, flagellar regulatory protein
MSQFSVAVFCHDAEVAARVLHCLEFLGVAAAIVDRRPSPDSDIVVTDDVDSLPAGNFVPIQLLLNGSAMAARNAAICVGWPLHHDDLVTALAQARTCLTRRGHTGGGAAARLTEFPGLVGDSEALQRVKLLMNQVADSDATVLITGESGTGKEVVARSLHDASRRREQPFVPINCGAIPAELLESELFGHEKGAFTGALDTKKGRFELAHGGTLFLDEIGDMPPTMQVKLLRAIQEKSIERIGSTRSMTCDVRIIAATHQDLEQLISENRFREDLYYRLAVFPIVIPPLRERPDDVHPIAIDKLRRLRATTDSTVTLSPDAWSALRAYEWPGNVRELANLVERMLLQFPNDVVDVADLPVRLRTSTVSVSAGEPGALDEQDGSVVLPVNGIDLRAFLADMERSLIKQALDDTESIVAHAADRLHIRRTTLVEKMRKYGIRREAL